MLDNPSTHRPTNQKKMIKRKASLGDLDILSGSKVKDLKQWVIGIIDRYGEDAVLNFDTVWDYPYQWYIEYRELETEEEYFKRQKVAAQRQDRKRSRELKKEAQEKKELARLQEKYATEL